MRSNLSVPNFYAPDPMDELFHNFLRPLRWENFPAQAPQIKLDVTETDNIYTVKAEIPGVRKEDIDIRIEGNQVSLNAEVNKQSEEKKDGRVIRSERYHGFVSRTFSLGANVDQAKASAKYENGVLELVLPKRESTEGKRLTVR
jgi:HSP20 family protein